MSQVEAAARAAAKAAASRLLLYQGTGKGRSQEEEEEEEEEEEIGGDEGGKLMSGQWVRRRKWKYRGPGGRKEAGASVEGGEEEEEDLLWDVEHCVALAEVRILKHSHVSRDM